MWFLLGKYPIVSNFIGNFARGNHMNISTLLYKDDDAGNNYHVETFSSLTTCIPYPHIT